MWVLWCVKTASTLSQSPHGCIYACTCQHNGTRWLFGREDYLGPAALVRLPSTWQLLDYKIVRIFAYQVRASSQTKGLERGWKQRVRLGRGEARALSFSGGSGDENGALCACTSYSYAKPILRRKKNGLHLFKPFPSYAINFIFKWLWLSHFLPRYCNCW